jgi:hypothetical protein
VIIDDTVINIRRGAISAVGVSPEIERRALRLSYALAAARRTPMMSLAGTDLDALERAIDALQLASTQLADIQRSRREARAVRVAVYPLGFLRAVREAERARRVFIAQRTEIALATYEDALRNALAMHHRDLMRYTRAFQAFVPHTTRRYGTAQKVIDRENSLASLEALGRREQTLAATLRDLERCLRGNIEHCDIRTLAHPMLIEPRALAPVEDMRIERVRAFYTRLGYDMTSLPPVTIESVCVAPDVTPPVFVAAQESSGPAPAYEAIIPLGNIRFFSEPAGSGVPYLDFFATRGVTYVPAKELNHYNCPEMDSDVGAIYGMYGIRSFALDMDAQTIAGANTLRTAAERLQGVHTLVETTAFARAMQDSISRGETTPDVEHAFTEHLIALRDRSAGYEWNMQEIARIETRNLAALGNGAHPELSSPFLFFARSGIYALLMQGNASFGPLPSFFEIKSERHDNEPYRYFTSFADDVREYEKAMHEMRLFQALHQDPS